MSLKERLDKATPEEQEQLLERIRDQFEKSDFAELVKLVFEKFEEMCVAQIKGYGGNDNERLWNCVGRLQAAELLKVWIFARPVSETTEETEGEPNA